ncbi:MAG: M23 family metallopeptidase [Synechococcus sp.]
MRLCISATTLLISAGLVAIGGLTIQGSAGAASSFFEMAYGPSTTTTKPLNELEKPELSSSLSSSDKSLPDELLDLTNLEPAPGTPLLSPQLLNGSHDLHQPVSSFRLPYGLDESIGGPTEDISSTDTIPQTGSSPPANPSPQTNLGTATEPETTADNLELAPESTSDRTRTVPYRLKTGESVDSLANRFALSEQSILAANEAESLTEMSEGDIIQLPWVPTVLGHEDFSTANHEAFQLARLDTIPVEDVMIWPTNGLITSRYGWRWGRIHAGIDIAGPEGTPVVAALSGRVIYSGWYYAYGYMVDIEHANGTVTRYAHASRLYVSVGEQVKQGQPIMAMGNTGRSTGPHLHFEVRQNGYAINPLTVLNGSSPSQNVASTYY